MISDAEIIKSNIMDIRAKIAKAAEKSGRRTEDITFVAVTKTIGVESIIRAIDEGICNLGENRVQELCEKYDVINGGCNWHLIGHLQTNKVKYIVDKVALIHSVDSISLAREINRLCEKSQKVMDVLVQVNVSGEESKFGIPPETAVDFLKQLSIMGYIRVRGLMTIAPFTESTEDVRRVFRDARKIFIDIAKENIDNIFMNYLSMGMSGDYEAAIEEGSNMVRIGTAIFGRRS